ncbi:MAG: hypothetical protein K2H61_03685, partial [Muribaculaceae bacterium]|nr:hypothetical protein [Muribaculaceae bacterium]
NKVGLTALEKRVSKNEDAIEELQQSLEETNSAVETNAAGIAENRNLIGLERAARETAVSDLRSEIESQHEELTEYADSAAEQAVETVKAQLKIYPFDGIAPTVNAVVSDGIFWIINQSKFYRQGSPVYQSGGKADEQRVYSCGGRLYSIVEGVLTKYIREDELSNAAAATEAKIEQKIETAIDELRDEVSAYADESSEQAVKRLQSEIKVYGFDGIAPTLGSIAADNDGVMWVINEKQFFRKGTKVYLDTTGKPSEACLYSMGGRMYAVVGGDLCKFVREDEVTESIATVKGELEDEMEEKLDVLADEQTEYTNSQAEVAAAEMRDRIGVYDFEGIYETAEDIAAPKDGAFYWIERAGVFLHGVAMGNVIELFEAFHHLTEGDLTERYLFRYNGNLYRVEDGTLRRYVTEREVEELEQKIETAIDELHEEVNEYADDAADGAFSRAVAQAGIYPFDGLQGSIGSMPADGKIYWVSGEKRFVSKNESGVPTYHYEPTGGYADRKTLYRCDNRLYKVTSWNQLVEFVDSDKLEEREQHLETFAINVADEAVWRAKEELFADLWENYLTVWSPFGGVAGNDNKLPHFSLKIGGVEIDENGYRRYK